MDKTQERLKEIKRKAEMLKDNITKDYDSGDVFSFRAKGYGVMIFSFCIDIELDYPCAIKYYNKPIEYLAIHSNVSEKEYKKMVDESLDKIDDFLRELEE